MANTTEINVTEKSKALFIAYAKDADNWGGTPPVGGNVGGSAEDRGNLTQLKQAGVLVTFRSDGMTWVEFTEVGKQWIKEIEEEEMLADMAAFDAEESLNSRVAEAARKAVDAFWEAIGVEFPETQTGDLAPAELAKFEQAAADAVRKWVSTNLAPAQLASLQQTAAAVIHDYATTTVAPKGEK